MGTEGVNIVLSIITASTPLLLAATGELITEKSGVLNLGLEGMMLVGAVIGFAATVHSGSTLVGVAAAIAAGIAMAMVFSVLSLTFLANQVATGLALTIFGTGLSALMGTGYVGTALQPLPKGRRPSGRQGMVSTTSSSSVRMTDTVSLLALAT